ncbi:COMPASS complex protein [Lentinula edodes]|nr:COMPASS complex protein [Lentinula edodes]
MLAELSSPPPEARPSPQPTTAPSGNKKRKRGGGQQQQQQPAGSPAPSDSGTPEVLTSRTDLFSRPQLKFSRGPIFTPISEGSIYHKTDLIGVNRVGFRYIPAGINPPSPSNPTIHFHTIESHPASYRVSWEDRSAFIHVTKDGLGLLGSKGHRSARGNAPVREGKWYMEVKVLKAGGEPSSNEGMREGCYVRLGWGRREAPLNGPVGLDGYSYGFRDKTGEKVTLSRPRPYGRPFRSGDVVGMYISLPTKREADEKDPTDPAHLKRERIAIDFKGQEMFEMQEYPQSKEMIALMDYEGKAANSTSVPSTTTRKGAGNRGGLAPPNTGNPVQSTKSKNLQTSTSTSTTNNTLRPLPTLPNSRIAFFINGQPQGTAFHTLYDFLQLPQSERKFKEKDKKKPRTRDGLKESHKDNPFDDGSLGYYPFISLFNDAEVRINPGPVFEYPPAEDIDAVLDGTRDPDAIIPDTPTDPSLNPNPRLSTRTWRPLSARYPEYMAEQWELDEREELEAQETLAELDAQDRAVAQRERQKKAQRERKRKEKEKEKETEARKRTRVGSKDKGGVVKEKSPSVGLAGGLGLLSQPQPSPLRHASVTAYEEYEEYGEFKDSPAAYAAPGTPLEPPQDTLHHTLQYTLPDITMDTLPEITTDTPVDIDTPPHDTPMEMIIIQETPSSPAPVLDPVDTPGLDFDNGNGDDVLNGGEDRGGGGVEDRGGKEEEEEEEEEEGYVVSGVGNDTAGTAGTAGIGIVTEAEEEE